MIPNGISYRKPDAQSFELSWVSVYHIFFCLGGFRVGFEKHIILLMNITPGKRLHEASTA
jgi:hypothetical protein